MQSFRPTAGPQQVTISNTKFEAPRIRDQGRLHQLIINETVLNQTSTKTKFQDLDFSNRLLFDIQDYFYTPASNLTSEKQFVSFKNVSVRNIDFTDIEGPYYFRSGSFIRASRSNLHLELMTVANVSSKGNGAFLNVHASGPDILAG